MLGLQAAGDSTVEVDTRVRLRVRPAAARLPVILRSSPRSGQE